MKTRGREMRDTQITDRGDKGRKEREKDGQTR